VYETGWVSTSTGISLQCTEKLTFAIATFSGLRQSESLRSICPGHGTRRKPALAAVLSRRSTCRFAIDSQYFFSNKRDCSQLRFFIRQFGIIFTFMSHNWLLSNGDHLCADSGDCPSCICIQNERPLPRFPD